MHGGSSSRLEHIALTLFAKQPRSLSLFLAAGLFLCYWNAHTRSLFLSFSLVSSLFVYSKMVFESYSLFTFLFINISFFKFQQGLSHFSIFQSITNLLPLYFNIPHAHFFFSLPVTLSLSFLHSFKRTVSYHNLSFFSLNPQLSFLLLSLSFSLSVSHFDSIAWLFLQIKNGLLWTVRQ